MAGTRNARAARLRLSVRDDAATMPGNSLSRVGIVVHPTRSIDSALSALREWADAHDVDVAQVRVEGNDREVAEQRDAEDCDLVAAVGGDGTMLAAVRAAAGAGKPVLGIACGSLGVLTSVTADDTADALDRFAAGDWTARPIPALRIERDGGEALTAVNDLAITRRAQGQVMAAVEVDGEPYARFVGDGFVVTTPIGSSGYTLAAGGPLLAPGIAAFALTPLAAHGGSIPPVVVGEDSELRVEVEPGYGGIKFELDGRLSEVDPEHGELRISLEPDAATLVGLDGQDSVLAGLRRKRLLMDSPRVLARDQREESSG
jgi:NAD+ kinase